MSISRNLAPNDNKLLYTYCEEQRRERRESLDLNHTEQGWHVTLTCGNVQQPDTETRQGTQFMFPFVLSLSRTNENSNS